MYFNPLFLPINTVIEINKHEVTDLEEISSKIKADDIGVEEIFTADDSFNVNLDDKEDVEE
eukprot:13353556-Ditylum_brightwellii.AAC.1